MDCTVLYKNTQLYHLPCVKQNVREKVGRWEDNGGNRAYINTILTPEVVARAICHMQENKSPGAELMGLHEQF